MNDTIWACLYRYGNCGCRKNFPSLRPLAFSVPYLYDFVLIWRAIFLIGCLSPQGMASAFDRALACTHECLTVECLFLSVKRKLAYKTTCKLWAECLACPKISPGGERREDFFWVPFGKNSCQWGELPLTVLPDTSVPQKISHFGGQNMMRSSISLILWFLTCEMVRNILALTASQISPG